MAEEIYIVDRRVAVRTFDRNSTLSTSTCFQQLTRSGLNPAVNNVRENGPNREPNGLEHDELGPHVRRGKPALTRLSRHLPMRERPRRSKALAERTNLKSNGLRFAPLSRNKIARRPCLRQAARRVPAVARTSQVWERQVGQCDRLGRARNRGLRPGWAATPPAASAAPSRPWPCSG
jgi:hypothetical protein